MTTARPCLRECTIRGRHLPGCPCAAPDHEHAAASHTHEDPAADCTPRCTRGCGCTGCMPRPAADDTLLCGPCLGRITRALLDAPSLVGWIRANVTPCSRSRGDVLREAPAPLSLDAVSDADDLHALLAAWAQSYAQLAGLTGPSWEGSAVSSLSWSSHPLPSGARRLTCSDPRVIGLLSDADHEAAVGRISTWLLRHARGIAALPWAADWHEEIAETFRRTSARWPREPHAYKLPLPCPACDRVLLWKHPPPGGPVRDPSGEVRQSWDQAIACHGDDCGLVLTEKAYLQHVQEAHQRLTDNRRTT